MRSPWINACIITMLSTALLSVICWQILVHTSNLTKAGEIGSLVGGIAGPIVALVSVILLVWTLYNQHQIRYSELLSRRFDHLREDVQSIHLDVVQAETAEKLQDAVPQALRGSDAIAMFVQGLLRTDDQSQLICAPFVLRLYFILGTFDTLCESVEAATLPGYDKRHHISRLGFLYSSHFVQPLTALVAASERGELKFAVTRLHQNEAFPLERVIAAHQKMIAFIRKYQV